MDDRRIWKIAEALRRELSYEKIHDITKIDIWFIDKLAILVEMEQALKAQQLDRRASSGSKTHGVPGLMSSQT